MTPSRPNPRGVEPAQMPAGEARTAGAIAPALSSLLDWFDFFGRLGRDPARDGVDNLRAPDRSIRLDPDVKRAAASVVRIRTDALKQGTGWVAAPELVVTNAHVMQDATRATVQERGRPPGRRAHVVYFDARQDLAILRVPGLRARPLKLDPSPTPGESGAVLGFPGDGPHRIRSVRWGGTRPIRVTDTFGRRIERNADEMRGKFEPGNSGGPVVGADGRVLSTISAKKVYGIPGGFGVPNDTVRAALRAPRHRVTAREVRAPGT